ncbi:MAG: hypothetical protein LBH60_06090 [Prevotellaceae bacterium]|jgi:hypothetical protein|nr:hypothetical protein [Prevotellaceae bacterium]
MKSSLFILSFIMLLGIESHAQAVQTATKDPVEEKAKAVATRLNLDENKKKSVYNIFSQTEKRIADLALGTPDYAKLINYINQERSDMLKTALSPDEFASYQKFYAASNNTEINAYIKKNNAFLSKQATEEAKAEKSNKKIMQADKLKMKKEEEKQKLADKKAADKQKLADKKAEDKQKMADKKEKERQKIADKKEKDRQKKEIAKQKDDEKRNAAKQKALEKKQKELDKKLNKK